MAETDLCSRDEDSPQGVLFALGDLQELNRIDDEDGPLPAVVLREAPRLLLVRIEDRPHAICQVKSRRGVILKSQATTFLHNQGILPFSPFSRGVKSRALQSAAIKCASARS